MRQTGEGSKTKETRTRKGGRVVIVVCRLLNVSATSECISGTDLLNFVCCHTEIEVAD